MRRILFILIIFLTVGFITGCSSEDKAATKNLPKISEGAITKAQEQIEKDELVKDSAIVIEEDYVALALILEQTISQEEAKELAVTFARLFGDVTASYDQELKGSSADSFGGIYDHYNLTLAVVDSPTSEDFLAGGSKTTDAKNILWDEDNQARKDALAEVNRQSEKLKEKAK